MENLELVKPDYWDSDLFGERYIQMYRYNSHKGRLYYRIKNETDRIFYTSVTTAVKSVLPTSKYLIDWMLQYGEEEAERKKEEAAEYGTMMHVFIAKFLKNRYYDFSKFKEDVEKYPSLLSQPLKYMEPVRYMEKLKKDLLSYMQFAHDYEVKPLAIETIIFNDNIKLAGAIDIICEMNALAYTDKTPKNTRKRVIAIGDNKSGRNGFYDSHIVQLGIYQYMWNEKYPEIPVDRIFNWAPKDWRSAIPSYNFKCQNDDKLIGCLPHFLGLIKEQCVPNPSPRMVIDGRVKLGESPVDKIKYSLDFGDLEKEI